MRKVDDFVIENGILLKCKDNERVVTVPDEVTAIANAAFSRCEHITRVILPETVTGIDAPAFFDCRKLRMRSSAGSFAHRYTLQNDIPFEAV